MSEIIEHDDAGNGRVVRVGQTHTQVSLKVYQDIYHQVTGRTEQIRKRYSDNILAEFSDLEQLHHKISQLCDVHHVVARNETISVFHDKERKELFTSFERFRAYNGNATSPSVNVVLKYNFSIVPAGLERPQEYVVTVRLTSRVAAVKQLEDEAPPFMAGASSATWLGALRRSQLTTQTTLLRAASWRRLMNGYRVARPHRSPRHYWFFVNTHIESLRLPS
jgi:hypothetical protein